MKSRKKIIAIAIAGVLIAAIGAGSVAMAAKKEKVLAAQQNQVQTATVEKKDLANTISVSGTIVSAQTHSLTADLPETKVLEVKVKVGDEVKKGDTIAVFDSRDIERQLAVAQSNLNVSKTKTSMDIAGAQRNYENAMTEAKVQTDRSASDVQKAQGQYDKTLGDINAANAQYQNGIVDRKNKEGAVAVTQNELITANTAVKDRENELTNARNDAEARKQKIDAAQADYNAAVQGGSPDAPAKKAVLDTVTAEYNQAATAVAQLQGAYDTAKANAATKEAEAARAQTAFTEAKTKEAELESTYKQSVGGADAVKNGLEKAQETKSDTQRNTSKTLADQKDALASSKLTASNSSLTQEQEVEKYQKQLAQCTVVAPADGMVTSVSIKEGETYKGGEIAMLQDDKHFKVSAVVDQYDISDIQTGMRVMIKTGMANEEEMTGQVSFVSPTPKVVTTDKGVTSTSSDYAIEASVENPSDRLRIGMTTKLTIIVMEKKGVWVVPDTAVQTDENGKQFIEVVEAEGDATGHKKISVSYGMKTNYYVEIVGEGLKENMQVVIPAQGQAAEPGASGV